MMNDTHTCPHCNGAGTIIVRHPLYGTQLCPLNYEWEEPCYECRGRGWVVEDE